MIIGNVVTSDKNSVKATNLNVVSDISEIDNEYPTLLVGYYSLRDNYNYNLDFITHKITDNLFWTFTKEEDRTGFNEDLYKFIIHCEGEYIKGFNYFYFDPFETTLKKTKKIIKHIISGDSTYMIDKEVLFIHKEGVTIGFNLSILEIIGVNINKIYLRLEKYNITKVRKSVLDSMEEMIIDMDYNHGQILYLLEKNG